MSKTHDIALVNAKVRTVDSRDSVVDAILMRGGRIAAVGTTAEVRGMATADADVVDLAGRAVTPGFIDAHNHLSIAAFAPDSLDCSDPSITTLAGLLTSVEQQCAQAVPGQWVMGLGLFAASFSEGRNPTRFELDEVSPENPLMLLDLSCHAAIANSRALAMVGINSHTPQPWGGEIVKDHKGEPTGELLEAAINLVQSAAWSGLAERDWDRSVGLLEAKMREYLSLGITGVGDALVTPRFSELYRRAEESGRLPMTVQQLRGGDHFFSQQDLRGTEFVDRIRGGESQMLRGGAVKIFADRGYPDGPAIDEIHDGCTKHVGTSFYTAAEVHELAIRADALGVTPVIHALGSCAMGYVLDAYESVRRAGSDAMLRMEHAFVAEEGQAARMASLGVDLVANPGLLYHAGDFFSTWRRPGQAHLRIVPVRSMIDAGVRVSLASDHPCGPVSPAEIMWSAVTRTTVGGTPIEPDESITAAEALRLYTINAAAASGREHEEGSIELGKRANVLVLDRDPVTCSTDDLRGLHVDRTYVDGTLAHSAEEG